MTLIRHDNPCLFYSKNEAQKTKLRTTYARSQALIIINDVDDDSLDEFFPFP